jgi:hypothetical protein
MDMLPIEQHFLQKTVDNQDCRRQVLALHELRESINSPVYL